MTLTSYQKVNTVYQGEPDSLFGLKRFCVIQVLTWKILSDKIPLTGGEKMNLPNKSEKTADITVSVDVSKIVRNVSIAGVLVVGIISDAALTAKYCSGRKTNDI